MAHAETTSAIRTAVDKIDPGETDVLVIVSPHGRTTGIYSTPTGSLQEFGIPGIDFSFTPGSEVAADLAARWDRPLIDEPIDHGCSVPRALLNTSLPTVMCTLEWDDSTDGAARALGEGRSLAAALEGLEKRVFVVASAHGSAGIGPRAPLGERPVGETFDAELAAALNEDPRRLLEIPADRWHEAGACGAGPLATLGHLFASGEAELLGYSHPFGVGYFVARMG